MKGIARALKERLGDWSRNIKGDPITLHLNLIFIFNYKKIKIKSKSSFKKPGGVGNKCH